MKKWLLLPITLLVAVSYFMFFSQQEKIPSYLETDFEIELFDEVTHVIRGVVVNSSSRWVNESDRNEIKTFVSFSVEEYLKGSGAETVELVYSGGVVGNISQSSSLNPGGVISLDLNNAYIVFAISHDEFYVPMYCKIDKK